MYRAFKSTMLCAATLLASVAPGSAQHVNPMTRAQQHSQYREQLRAARAAGMPRPSDPAASLADGTGFSGSVGCTNNPVLGTAPSTNINFNSAARVDAGGGGYWDVQTADFNGDGKMDMATIVEYRNCTTSTWVDAISVILNQGGGKFAPASLTLLPGTTRLYNFVVGDVNKDGKADIVVGTNVGVITLLGNGDGTFTASAASANANLSWKSQLLDFDGDGIVDIVRISGSSLSWFKGVGNGTFLPAQSVTLPISFRQAVLADVNNDGKLDVVGTYYDSTNAVYTAATVLGTGTGTFAANANVAVSSKNTSTCDFAVGDVNGDHFLDLATADCGNETATVFVGNGDGTFKPGVSVFAGWYPSGITIADVNGDGKGDLLVIGDDSSTVDVLLSNNGAFTGVSYGYAIGGYAYVYPAVADFDGDGKMDLAVPDDDTANISVLHGFGDGTFKANTTYYAPLVRDSSNRIREYWSWQAASADLNGDGFADFVATGCCGYSGAPVPNLLVYLNNGDGTFSSAGYSDPNTSATHYVEAVAIADFNGDGKPDVAMADYYSSTTATIMVFPNNGNGTFAAPILTTKNSHSSYHLSAGDFNGDGKQDLVAVGSPYVDLYLGNGDGTFKAPTSLALATYAYGVKAADVNKDGKMDIVVADYQSSSATSSHVSIFLGNGDGTFQPRADYQAGGGADDVYVADLNGDGWPDVFTINDNYQYGQTVTVLLNNGDGTFKPGVSYPVSAVDFNLDKPYPEFGTAADINGDGKMDIIVANSEIGATSILYGVGDGTFFAPVESTIGQYDAGIAAADVDHDGAIDVMTAGDDYPGMTVSRNTGGAKLALASSANPTFLGQPVTLTATVSPTVRGVTAVPAGSVNFFDGQTKLGTGTVSGGAATFSTSALAQGNHSITALYGGDVVNFVPGASGFLNLGVQQPPIATLTSLSPSHVTSGAGDLTLQVNGSNFVSGSVVQWNGNSLSTTFVSSTQIKATVPGTNLATVGTASVTVLNPGTSGGVSNALSFAIDTPAAKSTFTATITDTQTVSQGSTATYNVNVTFNNGQQVLLTVKCYNLPTGAACSYDNPSKKLTITTSANTPKGTWNVVVVFTPATHSSLWLTSALATLLPFGLLAGGKLRRRKLIGLAVLGLLLLLVLSGCGSSFSSSSLQQQQSSATAVLNVI